MNRDFICYQTIGKDSIFSKLADLIRRDEDDKISFSGDRTLLYECMAELVERASAGGFYGNLWHVHIAELIVNDENAYSLACERRGEIDGSVNDLVLMDMEKLREYFDYDFSGIIKKLGAPELPLIFDYRPDSADHSRYNKRIRDRICNLADELSRAADAKEMKAAVTAFYKDFGVGKLGLHKAFRDLEGEIIPIKNIRHVKLSDLVGYEIAKKKLVDNTDAFIEGKPSNNCLLYGDAGTGKSTCIKAIANEYYDKGLRIIEVYRHQFKDLNHIIDQIKGRNYRFIIYMDDLSFEDFETEYKYLKAVIEGGLEKKPENLLMYATSNRRHLIKESFSDKKSLSDEGDIHRNDTVQEKLSLADRFGVSIYFGRPSYNEYQNIVITLAQRAGLDISEEELLAEARKWEMAHSGLSGRTASQFIDYLLGLSC